MSRLLAVWLASALLVAFLCALFFWRDVLAFVFVTGAIAWLWRRAFPKGAA